MSKENYQNISKDLIYQELSPIYPILYSVLETAQAVVPECIDIFRQRCSDNKEIPSKVYKYLYPSLMRAIMQVLFHSQNIKTQALFDFDGDMKHLLDWETAILSNNGLAGNYAGYNYRILKALKGKLPPPGYSKRKQEYYKQTQLRQYKFSLFPSDNADSIQKPNIIFLWESINISDISLLLSCPRWGNATKVSDYFTVSIEHPILTYIPDIKPEAIIEDIDIEIMKLDEVDMSSKEEDQEKRDD